MDGAGHGGRQGEHVTGGGGGAGGGGVHGPYQDRHSDSRFSELAVAQRGPKAQGGGGGGLVARGHGPQKGGFGATVSRVGGETVAL